MIDTKDQDSFGRYRRGGSVSAYRRIGAPGYQEAFADLCKLYWYPLYALIEAISSLG